VGGTPMQHYHDTTTGVTDLVSLDGEPTQTHTKSATPSDNLNKAVEEILHHLTNQAYYSDADYAEATQALLELINNEKIALLKGLLASEYVTWNTRQHIEEVISELKSSQSKGNDND